MKGLKKVKQTNVQLSNELVEKLKTEEMIVVKGGVVRQDNIYIWCTPVYYKCKKDLKNLF